MAYTTGVHSRRKMTWIEQLKNLIGTTTAGGSLKLAIMTGNSHTALDANADPTTPPTLASIIAAGAAEMSATGTGYTTGGFVLDQAVYAQSGASHTLQFSNVGGVAGTIVTGTGAIAAGNYTGVVYDTADSNRVLAIFPMTVTTSSNNGIMTFNVPANAIAVA